MELPHKVGIAGLVVSVVGITFGWVIFPSLLKSQIGKLKGLARGSESREFWEKTPFALDFKVYVFNVTNYKTVQELGDLPMLDEIGPYYFDEWKEKVDIVDFEEDDSISFRFKNTFVLNKEKSAPLTGRETIAVPHPLLLGVVGAAERDKPSVLSMINSAIPALFSRPTTVFFVGPVLDALFDGMTINCTGKDFYSIAVCSVLKKEVKELVPTNVTNLFKYSIFGAKNFTSDWNKFKVYRGINDPQKVGEVVSVNGKKKLPFWRGRPCNDIQGTDSTIFPPSIKKDRILWSYSMEICRSVPAVFQGPESYKSVEGLYYSVRLGDMSKEPSLKCFCPSETTCLKQGAMDLMRCTGAPIVATLPHFYDSHEDYLKGVRGLHPNKKDHELKLVLEPMTGTPLYAKKRIMFSMPVHKIRQINLTHNLPDTLIPIFWAEEGIELSDEFMDKIDTELFRIIRIVDVVKWLLLILGSVIMVAGVSLYYKKKNALAVTPSPESSKRAESPNAISKRYLDNKKTQGLELGVGHTNYGYI